MSSTAVAPRARKSFSRLKHVLDLPNLIDIQKASFEWFKNEGLRETIDDISPIEDYTGTLAVEFGDFEFGESAVHDPGVPREGPDLPGAALDDGPLRQQGDGRDPRAAGLHGRLPDDDRVGHVHHQRHRARDRDAARPQPGRLPDGAEGRDEAGLHREPDAEPRLVARARDRQEGHRLRPHRPEAQAAGDDAPARARARGLRRRAARSTRTRTCSSSSTTRPSSRTRWTRTRRPARKRRSSRSSRSSAPASRRRSTTRATSSARSSSTRSATT